MGRSNKISPAEIDRMFEFVASKNPRGKDEWVAMTADMNIGATAKSVRTWEQIRNKFNRLRSDACATDHGHQAAKDAQKLIDEHGRVFERGAASSADLSREEEILMLDTAEDSLPYTKAEWDVVAAQYNSGRTDDTGASETGSGQKADRDCPETVKRAKHLRRNIEALRDAENLDGGAERESDFDETGRDSDRVEGSDNNPSDNSSQGNESDTIESSNRRGDCRNAIQDISDIVSLPGDEADAFATNSAITTITTATAKKGKSVSRAGNKRKAVGYIPARQASLTYPAVGGDDNPANHE
ncbi:hypothetical protein PsorP6_016554 [Peronosclerospora sorghi]|uniref:Uncharacterized protein n=1 Tax=Peronosclerospora sorghi TaxID=230839 RepID=A0ACC0VJM3_9STRA|nr:hypothetical protein PsorP6_016554 [Peronosclerospora sorghi]